MAKQGQSRSEEIRREMMDLISPFPLVTLTSRDPAAARDAAISAAEVWIGFRAEFLRKDAAALTASFERRLKRSAAITKLIKIESLDLFAISSALSQLIICYDDAETKEIPISIFAGLSAEALTQREIRTRATQLERAVSILRDAGEEELANAVDDVTTRHISALKKPMLVTASL